MSDTLDSARSWVTPPPDSARNSIHSFGTPRDDRFFSPRTLNSGSQSDDWVTPRGDSNNYNSSSSNGYNYNGVKDSKGIFFNNNNSNNHGSGDEKLAEYRLYTDHKQSLDEYNDNDNVNRFETDFVMDMSKALPKTSSYHDNNNHGSASFMLDEGYGIGDERQLQYSSIMRKSTNNNVQKGYKEDILNDNFIDNDLTLSNHSTEIDPAIINETDIDEAVASGMVDGISEQDVEDIFSYARHGRINDIERLLDRGIPVNVRDIHGNSLLTIACQNGNKRVAKAVLRRGADMNVRNFKGNTPLHYCYHYGYGQSLGEYLISKGADAGIRNNEGRACWEGI